MGTRRQAREWALQLLFQADLNPMPPGEALKYFWMEREKADAPTRKFTEKLFLGTMERKAEIDETMRSYVENWSIERMGVIERNVLRMALHELLHRNDIPPAVTINEAIDLAKFFSNSESGRFVNGILDRVRKDLRGAQHSGREAANAPD